MNAHEALDRIAKSAQAIALEPGFSEEVARRRNQVISVPSTDSFLLLELAKLVAYSQNAKASGVKSMIAAGGLQAAFGDFDVARVVSADADEILQKHWKKPNDRGALSAMRYRKKVGYIIEVASAMQRLEKGGQGMRDILLSFPKRIRDSKDITNFWAHFFELRTRFLAVEMPFFRQTTSLLHLLLHFGFDCIKPDQIVMNVAKQHGLLPANPKEADLQDLVRLIQEYSLSRDLRPSVVDFYLLVAGRQTGVRNFIKP